MQFERIYADGVAEPPPGLWSNCLRVGNQVFVSGMVALDKEGKLVGKRDSFAQAKFIFECMQRYLVKAGGAMGDIASLNIYGHGASPRRARGTPPFFHWKFSLFHPCRGFATHPAGLAR
jgi:enamine deaminase RidA (YjgF/YER057c/UK114 family)